MTLIYFGQKPKEWILHVFWNNDIWITLTDASSYNINVWHHSIFSSRLMFWNWKEVQCFADQASIQHHRHGSPDVERIVPGESRKRWSEYRYARLMTLMILENKHVSLGGRHFNRGFTFSCRLLFIHRLHQYSMRCPLHHHRGSVPSCYECL